MKQTPKKFMPSEIEALKNIIQGLEPKPKARGISDTIKEMAELIMNKRKEGVSEEQIRDALSANGFDVSITTFRNALKAKQTKESSNQPKRKKEKNTHTNANSLVTKNHTSAQLNDNLQDEVL